MYAGLSLVIVIFVNLPQEGIYQFHGNTFFLSKWKDFAFSGGEAEGKKEKYCRIFCAVILIGFSLIFICS